MINDRLIWYLEHNNILTDIQCGFCKRKGTIDHLVRLESFIRDAFLNKQDPRGDAGGLGREYVLRVPSVS